MRQDGRGNRALVAAARVAPGLVQVEQFLLFERCADGELMPSAELLPHRAGFGVARAGGQYRRSLLGGNGEGLIAGGSSAGEAVWN
jgi:hypothetical protein